MATGPSAKAPLETPLLQSSAQSKAEKGPTLIFDGVCNLCNGAMHWYFDRLPPDNVEKVNFMWLQHPVTQEVLDKFEITNIQDSWAYFEDGEVSRGSTAWLKALRFLKAPWWILSYLLIFPECLREPFYNLVARNRYRLFGKGDVCKRPAVALKKRFLHDTVPPAAVKNE
ncbi:unnamed protein product [Amoebophrya sp. A120]|nr:unnamed protein product [Amoebophrya sp. A120]|eukprot:GSA120T00019573001.1